MTLTGSGTSWSGTVTNLTGNGAVTYTMVLTDGVGNTTTTSSASAFTVDNTPPTVTGVSSTLTNGAYKAVQAVPVTVTFSEAVTVTGTPQLTLTTGSSATTPVNYTSGSGTTELTFTYTVGANDTSADLDYAATTSLGLNGGTIKDAAGNDATLTLASPGDSGSLGNAKALVIDTTAPTVSITAPTASSYTNATAPTLSASVTDGVGVATVQFQITGAGGSTFANTGSAITSATTGSTYSYTMPSGTLSTDGVYQVRAVATDTAANSTTSSVVSFTVDTTRPAVALEYAIASSVPANATAASNLIYNPSLSRPVKAGEVVVVKAVATDTVGGVTATTLGSAMSVAFSGVTGSGTATVGTLGATDLTGYFTYTVAASTNGTVTVAATAPDAAGNSATTSGTTTFTVDTTAPDAPTNLTFTVNDGTTVTNALNATNTSFSVGADITVGQVGSAGGTAELLIDGASFSPTAITASVSNTASSVTLASGTTTTAGLQSLFTAGTTRVLTVKLTDSAGNATTSTANRSILADYTAPTVLTVATSASGSKTTGASVAITVTMSEAVTTSASATLTLETGTTDRNATCPAVTTSTTLTCTYAVVSGDTASRLDYVATSSLATSGTVRDAAGNAATLTLPATGGSGLYTANVVIDTTPPNAPTVALTSTDSGTASDRVTNVAPVIGVTAEAGSTVAVTATKDGTAFTLFTGLSSISGTGSQVSWTPLGVPASGSTGAALADGVYVFSFTQTDSAANVQSTASSLTVTVDTTPPTSTTVALTSTDSGTSGDRVTNVAPVIGVTAEAGSTVAVTATKDGTAFTLFTGLSS
ncbi:MAG: beta strand repeat-containing protein, partial [Chloroflexota bacterium]